MSISIVMPAVSPTMAYGTLVRCMKAPGEQVSVGDVIAEIETDKSIVELEAEASGVLEAWLVAEGTEEIPVGTALATLSGSVGDSANGSAGSAGVASSSPTAASGSQAPAPVPAPSQAASAPPTSTAAPAPVASGAQTPSAAPIAKVSTPLPGSMDLRAAVAAQLGVAGSDEPLHALLDRAGPARAVAGQTPSRSAASNLATAPVRPTDAGAADDPGTIAAHLGVPFERQPLSTMRKTIARRMTQAKRDTPHFYLNIECSVDALIQLRSELNGTASAATRISVNDLLIAVAATTLVEHPQLNVAWGGSDLVCYQQVDIAVAVATNDGLLTPVVRKADTLSVSEISAAMRALGERAQNGKLGPTDCLGGSMTLSNLGMYGIREASAVINPPQSSILAIGAALDVPVISDGAVVAAKRMRCTLSVDHRTVDGATAARFLRDFQARVEDPAFLAG